MSVAPGSGGSATGAPQLPQESCDIRHPDGSRRRRPGQSPGGPLQLRPRWAAAYVWPGGRDPCSSADAPSIPPSGQETPEGPSAQLQRWTPRAPGRARGRPSPSTCPSSRWTRRRRRPAGMRPTSRRRCRRQPAMSINVTTAPTTPFGSRGHGVRGKGSICGPRTSSVASSGWPGTTHPGALSTLKDAPRRARRSV